jgi:quercetin dioxygenase-like cupin family protein
MKVSVPTSKKLSDDRATIRKDLFGGNGAVQIWNCLSSNSTNPFKAALWCALEPGGFVGRHRQVEFPEVVLCVGGTGRAMVDDNPQPLEKGVLVYLPLGSTLSIHNESDKLSLEYVIIKVQSS